MSTKTPAPRAVTSPSERPERFGSGMLRRFGWFYRILGLSYVFSRLQFEDHNAERVRAAARQGPLVYVLLGRSTLDHLALNTVLNRNRLPLSVWSDGMIGFFWQPVIEAWTQWFQRVADRFRRGPRPHPVRSGWLTSTIASGQPTAVFLDPGSNGVIDPTDDPLAAALEACERTGLAVQLVPVILVWDRAPDVQESAALTFLRGSRERPSLLTRLRRLYLPSSAAPFVQVGEPLDLPAFLERVPRDRALVALRTLLRRYLKRESRTVRGPTILPRNTLKAQVLDAPPMRRFAEVHAKETGQAVERVRREMSREFEKIAADFRYGLILFLSWAMKPLWNRVYSGYEIPDEDLDRIRSAMRDGTAVLIPCHKSHFDYLLLSWVLFYANMTTPHVVAGINLAIWPVSRLLRSAGGFFIERSFAGKPVHAQVFDRYLRELLLHGYTVEFFIEGGRTRTGRLLPARTGVLEMVLNAATHAPPGHEITLLPVAISYEQVAEEQAYQSELQGADKRKEDVRELIKARRVLRNRYGRIFVRVGEPLRASEINAQAGPGDPERPTVVKEAGEQVVHQIGQVVTVLPTSVVAVALIAHERAAITEADLHDRVHRMVAWLARKHAALTSLVAQHPEAAVTRAVGRFQQAGHLKAHAGPEGPIIEIVPGHRILLDFHKNQIMQHFQAAGLVAAAVAAHAHARPLPEGDLLEGIAQLRSLLSRELTLPPRTTDALVLEEGFRDLAAHGALRRDDEGCLHLDDLTRLREVHGLIRGLLESYLATCISVLDPNAGAMDAKAWSKRITARQAEMIEAQQVTRPEAFASVTITHAVKTLSARGTLVQAPGGLAAEPPEVETILGWLRPMVEGLDE